MRPKSAPLRRRRIRDAEVARLERMVQVRQQRLDEARQKLSAYRADHPKEA